MLFNDRRNAKKAASATTKAQIGAMAKAGTLRATKAPTKGATNFNVVERNVVKANASQLAAKYGDSRKKNYAAAAREVSKEKDVSGYDAPAYRAMQEPGYKKGKK